MNKNQPTENSALEALNENVLILVGATGGVLLLIVLVFFVCKIKTKVSGNQTEGK
jgi:hypothetical protein